MKVNVLPETYAGEEVIQEAIDAAASVLDAGSAPPKAVVARDAAGKVVSVNVNLPVGTSAAQLLNAKNKINGNNGVSKAGAFPQQHTDDMEAGVAGQPIVTLAGGKLTVKKGVYNDSSPLEGSMDGKPAAGYSYVGLEAWASAFGLSAISSYTMAFKVKNFDRLEFDCNFDDLVVSEASGNWEAVSSELSPAVDTGADYADDTAFDIAVTVYPGIAIVSVNGNVVNVPIIGGQPNTGIFFWLRQRAGKVGQFDLVDFTILDGTA